MATDIADSITATFDEVCPVPDDGDYANHAALANAIRPALNRTEYLRARLETAPWISGGFFEDFNAPPLAAGNSRVWDTHWLVDSTAVTYTAPSGSTSADEAGEVVITNATAGAIDARVSKQDGGCRLSAVRRLRCKVRIGNIALAGMGFSLQLGVIGGAVAAIDLTWDPATSGNWLLRTNAGFDVVDTGVAVLANTYQTLEITHDGAANYLASVDGSTPVAPGPTIPVVTGATQPEFIFRSPAAGANRFVVLDYVRYELDMPGRA